MLVLEERRVRRRARGAETLGELLGYAATSDAHHLTAPEPTGRDAARAIELALADAGLAAGGRRLRQRPRDLDPAQRPQRDRGAEAGARRARTRDPGLLDQVGDRAPARRRRGGRGGRDGRGAAPATSRRRPSAGRSATPSSTSTTSPASRGRSSAPRTARAPSRCVAISNSFGFGGHNAVLCLSRMSALATAPRARRRRSASPARGRAAGAALRPGQLRAAAHRRVLARARRARRPRRRRRRGRRHGRRPAGLLLRAGPRLHGRLAGRRARRLDRPGDASWPATPARRWSASSSPAAPGSRRATPRSRATGASSAPASSSPSASRRSRSSAASRPAAAPTRPALTDFVVMTESARMFLTGPKVVEAALGEEVSMEELGGPAVHSRNGVCQLVARRRRRRGRQGARAARPAAEPDRRARRRSRRSAPTSPAAATRADRPGRAAQGLRRPRRRRGDRRRRQPARALAPTGRATWSRRSPASTAARSASSPTSRGASAA